jgi:SAM-dependent methyltransferase
MADANGLYATPRRVERVEDCHFYHVMDIPGQGMVGTQWDLRGGEAEYLGNVALKGRRVLEIGPATGFLTFYMESRGAEVVAVELAPEVDWDIVPDVSLAMDEVIAARRASMESIRNGFWFAHERFGSNAKVRYGSAYDLPAELGRFDVAVMLSVLLHTRDPLRIVEGCTRLADTLVVTDLDFPDLRDDQALMRWNSTKDHPSSDTWWHFSPGMFVRFLEVLGFEHFAVTKHAKRYQDGSEWVDAPLFTVVASRKELDTVLQRPSKARAALSRLRGTRSP